MRNVEGLILLSALADETRLRLVSLLVSQGERCVCELTHALGQGQPKISRHLSLLRESRLVTDRREGVWIHYRINPDLPGWAHKLLQNLVSGIENTRPYVDDRRALQRAPVRPPSRHCA